MNLKMIFAVQKDAAKAETGEQQAHELRGVRVLLYIHNSWFRGVTLKVMVLLHADYLSQVRCKEVCPIIGWNNRASSLLHTS